MIKYKEELIKTLKLSEKESLNLNHPYVGTEHFILAILKQNNDIKKILNKKGVNYNSFLKELNIIYKNNSYKTSLNYSPLLKKILLNSKTIKDAFIELLQSSEGIGLSVLNNLDMDFDILYNELKNSVEYGQYGTNLNELVKNNEIYNIYEREKEIKNIIEILCRKNKCNPLLIGEAGVGKTAIVEGLALKIVKKEVPEDLMDYNIISVSLPNIVSGTKYRGEFEEKLEKILKISTNNNTILFIDEIHTLVGAGGAEGAIDASNILKPFLARNKIKCIGSTTINEYNKTIYKDKALDRRFNKIIIEEPSSNSLKKIIYSIAPYYKKYHNVIIDNNTLDYIIDLTKKLYPKKCEPDRTIDFLDSICSKIKLSNNKSKLSKEISDLKTRKMEYLSKKEFNKAISISKKINNISKELNNYLPTITIDYIKDNVECKSLSIIGF